MKKPRFICCLRSTNRTPVRTIIGALIAAQLASAMPAIAAPPPPSAPAQEPPAPPKVTVNRTVPNVAPPPALPTFSAAPTPAEITRARVFLEPLVPVGGIPTRAQNDELAEAIMTYLRRGEAEGVAPFTLYLWRHPNAPWRASLLANLGIVYRRTGYFSRALRAWQDSWTLAKSATDPMGRAVADLAIGELLELLTKFGQTDATGTWLADVEGRDVRGSASAKVQMAREGHWFLTNHHGEASGSAQVALEATLVAMGQATRAKRLAIAAHHPSRAGTSLAQLRTLADQVGLQAQMAFRTGEADVPVPSIVHFKTDHFAAIVDRRGDQYLLNDPILGGQIWVSKTALSDETTGHFLLVSQGPLPQGFRATAPAEADTVRGHCLPGGPDPEDPCPAGGAGGPAGDWGSGGGGGSGGGSGGNCGAGGGSGGGGGGPAGGGSGPGPTCPGGNCGMPGYIFHPTQAALQISDTPVWYTPPRGPSGRFELIYNQRDQLAPQIFSFGNLGPKWTFDWQSYIVDTVTGGSPVRLVLRGSGSEQYAIQDFVPTAPHWRSNAILVRTSTNPIRYERRLRDGGVEVFAQPDGATAGGRRVFLTEIIDPRGQRLQFTYDSNLRLMSMTDALGQVTTLSYELATDSLKITKVTDPFGRFARFTYNASGQLFTITDVIGLTSSFVYGPGDFIAALTTPYGTTSFRHEPSPTGVMSFRFIEATDPLGGTERLEFHWSNAAIAATAPANQVPTGFTAYNTNLDHYLTLFWKKRAWMLYPGDVSKATVMHWLLNSGDLLNLHSFSTSVPHSVKNPLENRVWFAYPGQSDASRIGTWTQPSQRARVLDDGTTQSWQATYNSKGMVTSRTDPLGRRMSYTYAANGVDLLEVRQTTGSLNDLLAAHANYTTTHLPQSSTDAAGQTTTFTYNSAGQVLTVTNAKNETTTYAYDTGGNGYLQNVTGPVAGATTSYTYDGYGRVRTVTDADGYAVTTDYDLVDRPTRVTYPDGTFDQMVYDRLDLAQRRDRLGRITRTFYDALRRVTATRDAPGRTVAQRWCACGSLDQLIDAKGQATTWERDVQNRVTREVRANGTTATTYIYETTTSRLRSATDPKGQVTTYAYNVDDALQQLVFTNASIATPSVSYTYDANYNRVTTMVDGTGTTSYGYRAPGTLGAGKVASVDGPLVNDTITFDYDQLGRVTSRVINGVSVTWTYDALGRVQTEANALGTFTYAYVGVTSRPESVAYPNGQSTTYAYYDNLGDHRLQTLHNKRQGGATLSKFDYTYDKVGNILTWQQQADSAAPTVYAFGYDRADQLVSGTRRTTDPTPVILKRYVYTYDPAGNRTAEQIDDSVMGASYDSLNRLVTQQPSGPIRVAGTLNEPATVTVSGKAAAVDAANAFTGTTQVASGTNTFTVTATDFSGNQRTNAYEVDVTGSSKMFTYDANGNLTADGSSTFEWDAQNQLVAINKDTHRSEFAYDGFWRRVRIVEKENSSVISDQRFVWDGNEIAERRDDSGSVVTARLYRHGLQENGTARYVTRDHLMSIRDVTDSFVSLQARYEYAPYGTVTKVVGTTSDFVAFTGVLVHESSGLFLMKRRAYDARLGRWLSDDPLGMKEGPNLYTYVVNQPLRWIDPEGTFVFRPVLPNGNVTGGYRPQNLRPACDVPGFLGWEGRSCITKCCEAHDDCFENSRCNWSSWLTIAYDSPCSQCNRTAAACVAKALALPASGCMDYCEAR